MSSLFERKTWPPVDWRLADFPNLYLSWINSHSEAIGRLASAFAFTSSEIEVAAVWSSRQESWGLRAVPHGNGTGEWVVLEVFGPDGGLVPHCILHATEEGIQVDEFSGEGRVYPCLETALRSIAPIF